MKTLFKLLFCGILFISSSSCKNQVSENHLALKTQPLKLKLILNYMKTFGTKPLMTAKLNWLMRIVFTSDATVVIPGESIVGIENFRAYYNNYIVGFSEREFSIVKVFGQNDNLIKQWRFKGKHTGDFFGIPATDKYVDLSGVTIVEMIDGKIASEQDFFDNLDFLKQFGLM